MSALKRFVVMLVSGLMLAALASTVSAADCLSVKPDGVAANGFNLTSGCAGWLDWPSSGGGMLIYANWSGHFFMASGAGSHQTFTLHASEADHNNPAAKPLDTFTVCIAEWDANQCKELPATTTAEVYVQEGPTDGRLNDNWGDLVIVYGSHDSGIEVWKYEPSSQISKLLFSVSSQEIESAGPAENAVLLKDSSDVQAYLLPDGQVQVNADGQQPVFVP